MLLSSVILVLREVLEAAILISVLLALSLQLRLGTRWFRWALLPSIAGAFWFASALDKLTDALDGAGQELANAGLQFLVYLLALVIVALVARGYRTGEYRCGSLRCLMGLAVFCALVREGSELVIYIGGFAPAEELRRPVIAGSVIGAGIGISCGILMFAGLRALGRDRVLAVCLLLSLIGAGMVMQATLLLEQVDWLAAGRPIWDSSGLLSEQSIAGELLYAVFGYESTPSTVQAALYCASLVLMLSAWWLGAIKGTVEHDR